MNRHLSRIVAMQTLYEYDFRANSDLSEILCRNISEYENKVDEEYVRSLVNGTLKDIDRFDKLIGKSAPEWPIDQISVIDKNILRLAAYELTTTNDIPAKVVINEAIELGKQFGGDNSSKFINGVLGTIMDGLDEAKEDDK
ncbi:transcription antitermination factor NusB [Candidatus Berkelbacteria bacterium RIFOXYA2_FULL_43_10]|uniref:Transcription antitermination protein NusB n=1 Tax=Candidatus Berkelbacteria bacterium RIFOXYA2_FULL_43_10 TaxID=1797472 RepID=A0A1F5EEZ5_9BACT|nr:MAG: transcription antitermination factor NusB [Candidatus Berkelbacteria bacterium RIFOXYA2_FULL_43_10]